MFINKQKIYYLSAALLFLSAVFSLGHHHFDEHFQILEFAGLKLGLTNIEQLPWEYEAQMRSTIQPLMVILLYKCFALFSLPNPFFLAFFLRLLSATLVFYAMRLVFDYYQHQVEHSKHKEWFLYLCFFLWFAVYDGVRFSSENWSGTCFLIAFLHYFTTKEKTKLHFLTIGILLGLSFLFRYQIGFMIGGFLAWLFFIQKEQPLHLAYIVFGAIISTFFGFLADCWFYDNWAFTAWNYFAQNILQNKAAAFGTDPWWYYIKAVWLKAIPPFSILLILSTLLFLRFRFKSPITWSILPFFVIHCLIGHKELRFLFPIIGFMPIILIEGIKLIEEKWVKLDWQKKVLNFSIKAFWVINFLLLAIVCFKPANNQIALYRNIYNLYPNATTLYFLADNPYVQGDLNINFYKRTNLEIRKYEDVQNDVLSNPKMLLVLENQEKMPEKMKKIKLVASTFPAWIKYFNVNNWMSRTGIWNVYEIEL